MSEFRIADPLLRRIVNAVGIMGVIAFGFYTFYLLKDAIAVVFAVLSPFIIAFVLAYIMAPIVIALQTKLRLGRVGGTFALYMIVLTAIFIVMAILIPSVIGQSIKLVNSVTHGVEEFINDRSTTETLTLNGSIEDAATSPSLLTNAENGGTTATLSEDGVSSFSQLLDFDFYVQHGQQLLRQNLKTIAQQAAPYVKQVLSSSADFIGIVSAGLFKGVTTIIGFISFLVFVGIINFYIIMDYEKIGPLVRQMIPPDRRERVFEVLGKVDVAVGGFLRGQLTVSAIVGLMFAVGLLIIGMFGFPALRNYCILIGTAAAIGGFIPYLGPIMGVTPAILIVLLTPDVDIGSKTVTLVFVLGLFTLIQTLEGFVLQPRIVGKGAGLHPLVVMLALLAGAQFGIGGMILAVPFASIIRVLVREFYWLPIQQRDLVLADSNSAAELELDAAEEEDS